MLSDDEAAILVGDVSGKGVAAALLMAHLQATLRARLPLEKDLAQLAGELDREIHATTPPKLPISQRSFFAKGGLRLWWQDRIDDPRIRAHVKEALARVEGRASHGRAGVAEGEAERRGSIRREEPME